MAAMAKLWRFISPERIGFFLQKLEVLFASCYSIQNVVDNDGDYCPDKFEV